MLDGGSIALENVRVSAESLGLCWWDMVANKFCGDAEVARIFAIDAEELKSGVPVEALLGRLHASDRKRIAKSLHTAIIQDTVCRESYRVHLGKGRYREVLSVLRCFGYSEGLPTNCTGFICELQASDMQPAPPPQNWTNVVRLQRG